MSTNKHLEDLTEAKKYVESFYDQNDFLSHYGIKRRSGRYRWGSGKRPFQGEGTKSAKQVTAYNELLKAHKDGNILGAADRYAEKVTPKSGDDTELIRELHKKEFLAYASQNGFKSNEQLLAENTRSRIIIDQLKLQRDYLTYTKSQKSEGRKFVEDILKTSGKTLAVGFLVTKGSKLLKIKQPEKKKESK